MTFKWIKRTTGPRTETRQTHDKAKSEATFRARAKTNLYRPRIWL